MENISFQIKLHQVAYQDHAPASLQSMAGLDKILSAPTILQLRWGCAKTMKYCMVRHYAMGTTAQT